MFTGKTLAFAALTSLLALFGAPLRADDASSAAPIVARSYQSVVPLGADAFFLRPADRLIYLVASAGSIDIVGLDATGGDARILVRNPAGGPVHHYPRYVDFVVRASLVKRLLLDFPPPEFSTELDPTEYLSQLRFQVRIYCGLNTRQIEPAAVRIETEDERSRTYRVSFALKDVPVHDRVVLEVLTPDGQRISKFYMGI